MAVLVQLLSQKQLDGLSYKDFAILEGAARAATYSREFQEIVKEKIKQTGVKL